MDCRLCATPLSELVFQTERCPLYSHKYLQATELGRDALQRLSIYRCSSCQMVQTNSQFPPDEYSADYQRNISFSGTASRHAQQMADSLLQAKPITQFVEIGCGNGLFSQAIAARGVKVTAFEPSRAAAAAAKNRGIEVHNLFFDEHLPPQFSDYDGFALRFVLEHIEQPVEFLRQIASRCQAGAVGLIEVPNAQNQIDQKRWYEFFREHCLYFTPTTLAEAARRAGFEILELDTTMNNEFLKLMVRKPMPLSDWGMKEFYEGLNRLLVGQKKIAVWGASGAGATLLAELPSPETPFCYVIDSDPNKWNLHLSGSHLLIVQPERLRQDPPDAVLILVSAYQDEIVKSIRQMGFTGRVGTIFPTPQWLE